MKRFALFFVVCVAAATCLWLLRPSNVPRTAERPRTLSVAVQPLGKVSPDVLATAADAVRRYYGAEVTILQGVWLPEDTRTFGRKRYRAEKLLVGLRAAKYASYEKVVGLTERDISTTKGSIADWGVFGLGSLGGKSCVISTFRLGRRASRRKMLERLAKVVNHELGHTLGLDHCPTPGCMMADAKGSIATVDGEKGRLCPSCAKKIGLR